MKTKVTLIVAFALGAALLATHWAPLRPLPPVPPRLSPFVEARAELAARSPTTRPPDPIRQADLAERVKVLAADTMEGRRVGEAGAEHAASYLEREFRRLGLRPGATDGTYRQRFTARLGARRGGANRLTLETPGGPLELEMDREWQPLAFAAPTRRILRAPVVFCGYGITAADRGYDDYAGLDVQGRVALVLRFEPGVDDSLSPFDGTRLTVHADLRNKAKNAFDHGAAALLIVTGPRQKDEILPFDDQAEVGSGHLPAAQVGSEVLVRALAAAGVDLARVQAVIDSTSLPYSFPVELSTEMAIDVVPVTGEAFNVVGLLRGSDPDSQRTAIVVGAHYDHLGRGGAGSLASGSGEIHNGADDNASGVAALCEIAGAMASAPLPPARSVVFIAFTGEEKQLLGSTYYVNHPLWPLAATRAMINIDMIGRGRDREILVAGVGTSPRFRALVEEATAASRLTPVVNEGGYGPSDHTPFYSRNIPVLFFFTAPHEDYHRPTDDWEKLDFGFLESATTMIASLAGKLGGEQAPIEFARADGGLPRGGHGGGEGYGSRGYGPYLGTVPDFTPAERGVRLSGVREGSPAAAAGIQGGDIIVGWNGRPILNMQDYAQALKSHRPGDRVEIAVIRDGKQLTTIAVLGTRGERR